MDDTKNIAGLISSRDAAKLFGVTHDHISRLCRQKKIEGTLQAGVWFVERGSVERFFADRKVEAPLTPVYVSSRDAAKLYGVTHDHISRLCRQGKIAAKQEGGVWLLDKNSLADFFAKQGKSPRSVDVSSRALPAPQAPILIRAVPAPVVETKVVEVAPIVVEPTVVRSTSRVRWIAASVVAFVFVTGVFAASYVPTNTTNLAAVASNGGGVSTLITNFFAIIEKFFVRTSNAPVAVAPEFSAPKHTYYGTVASSTSTPTATTGSATVVTNTYPVIERTIEHTVTNTVSGISQSQFDQTLNALRSQIASISSGPSGAVVPYAPAFRIDKLSSVAITGGSISGAAISGGSLSNVSLNTADLSGVVSIANGGLGTSTAPSYGQVLLGNSSGTYDLVATSSLGIVSGGGGNSFAYLFPNNATSTTLTLNGGLLSSTSTIGTLNATSSATVGTLSGLIGGNNGLLYAFATSTIKTSQLTNDAGFATFAYPFTNNATTTRIAFDGGLTAFASSTIGNGNQNGGLTISGGATTTGGAYFAGSVGIGTNSPNQKVDVIGSQFISSKLVAGTGTYISTPFGESPVIVAYASDVAGAPAAGTLISSEVNTQNNYFSFMTNPSFNSGILFGNDNGNSLGQIIYGNSDNTLRFATNGSERVRFDANGNVGIGTTSPFAKLSVNGNGYFDGSLTATSLISTSSASLASTTLLGSSLLQNATTTTFAITGISLGSLLKTTTGGAVIAAVAGTDYVTGAGLASAFPFTVQSWGNSTSTTIGFTNGIISNASSTFASTLSVNGVATFNSNVGIGSSTPWAKLSVVNTDSSIPSFAIRGPFGGNAPMFIASGNNVAVGTSTNLDSRFTAYGGDGENLISFAKTESGPKAFAYYITGNDLRLSEYTTTTGSAQIDRFTFQAGGNLGIATTSPASRLSVQGNSLISGNLTVANVTATGTVQAVNLLSTGSSTVTGAFNSVSSNLLGSTTLLGNTLLTNATTTNFFVTLASTTNLFANGATTTAFAITGISSGSLLKTTTGGAVIAAVAGTDFENALTFNYPLTRSTNTISLAFGTSTSNTWGGTQTFTNTPVLGTLSGLVGSNNGTLYQIATSTNFVTALTAGSGISLSGSTGAVTVTNAIGYPFVGNATTTSIAFNGGLTATGATLASTTLTGNFVFANATGTQATTTNLAISSVTSSLLKTLSNGAVVAAVAGTDYANFAYPFSLGGYGTTTGLGIFASTTIGAGGQTTGLTISGGATTTGNAYFAGTLGVGTTSPSARLSIDNTGGILSSTALIRLHSFDGLNGSSNNASIGVGFDASTADYQALEFKNTTTGGGGGYNFINSNNGTTVGFRIDSTGRVGVGTTTPWARLSADTSSLAAGVPSFVVGSSTRTDFVITQAGNVGIGTTSPTGTFSIDGGTASSGNGKNIYIFAQNGFQTGNTSGGNIYLMPGSGHGITSGFGLVGIGTTTPGAALDVQATGLSASLLFRAGYAGATQFSLDTSGNFYTNTSVSIGTTTAWAARLSVDTTNLATGVPSFVVGSSTRTDFVITQAGNVGIGTTSPGTLLSVGNTSGINFTTATSTFSTTGGVNLTAGCFAVNGTCLSSSGSGGSGGGQLLALYATSTVGTTTVNFNGAAGSSPSFSGGTLTLPSNTSHIVVEVWGAGGGGGGGGDTGGAGGSGGNGATTCFSANATACSSPLLQATGGSGGAGGSQAGSASSGSQGGAPGSGSSGDINMSGGAGQSGGPTNGSSWNAVGGVGGVAPAGGGSLGSFQTAGAAFGGGGSGGFPNNAGGGPGGGGSGGYSRKFINNPSGSYTFTVGAGGSAGVRTGAASNGGAGGAGGIVISVYTTGVSSGSIGSGSAGYVPYYTSSVASTSLSATSTIFINTNSQVGISSSTPFGKFSIDTSNLVSGAPSFAVGSSTRTDFVITQAGNVGIGSTSPTEANLVVNGVSGKRVLQIGTSTNPFLFNITSSGNTNIGTLSGSNSQLLVYQSSGSAGASDAAFTVRQDGSNPIAIFQGSAGFEYMRVTGTMVHVGSTTPTDGHTTASQVHVGEFANLFSQRTTGLGIPGTFLMDNAYVKQSTGDFAPFSTGAASYIKQNGGVISIANAASGFTGIGSFTTRISVATNGDTTFTGSGGTCTITGAGGCTSDARLKEHITEVDGLDALSRLSLIKSVTFDWIDPSLDQRQRLGVLAQDVQQAFPQLVSTSTIKFMGTEGEYYLVDAADLTSPLIAAVNELNRRTDGIATTTPDVLLQGPFAAAGTMLKSAIGDALLAVQDIAHKGVRMLGDAVYATIGTFDKVFTQTLVATDVTAETVHAQTLCIGNTCVTEAELKALLNGQQTPVGNGSTTTTPQGTTTVPSISINGNNPATISVGDTYSDLGATAQDAEGHDLTIRTFFNGVGVDSIQVDTSAAATSTIDYVATDTWGNTATSTRTLYIVPQP